MNAFNKIVARILIVTVAFLGGQMRLAQAEIVSTGQALAQHGQSADRARVESMLAREDVRDMLEKRGVSYEQAKSRIDSLSDSEVSTLAGKIDSLPAGGDGFLGAVALIFIILLVTDILGLTKVFSFTRPVR